MKGLSKDYPASMRRTFVSEPKPKIYLKKYIPKQHIQPLTWTEYTQRQIRDIMLDIKPRLTNRELEFLSTELKDMTDSIYFATNKQYSVLIINEHTYVYKKPNNRKFSLTKTITVLMYQSYLYTLQRSQT